MKKHRTGFKAKHSQTEKDCFKLLADQIRELRTKVLPTNPALTGNQPATEPTKKGVVPHG
jgi:hypothetical protein